MQLNSQQFNARGKDPLVVLHGLFGSQDNWRSQALAWAPDRRVITLDLRNHGLSAHHAFMDYATMAEDVCQTLDELKLERVDLLGHSMGGKVAIQIALNQPQRLRSLLVADIAPVVYKAHHQSILAGLRSINLATLKSRQQALELLLQYEPDVGVCQFLLKSLYRNDTGTFALRYNLDAIEAHYPAISAAPTGLIGVSSYAGSTLVIKGANSNFILPQHKATFDFILPNTELKIMAGCGHWLHAQKPELFCRLVSRFLDQLP
jgi:esterase